MWKKVLLVGAVVLAAVMFAGCPTTTEEKPRLEKVELSVTAPGVYRDGTVIEFTVEPLDAIIYYTLDGTTPTEASPEYSMSAKPRMNFGSGNTVTVKAMAVLEGYEAAPVVEAEYTKWGLTYTGKMQIIAADIAASALGGDVLNPVPVQIPADFTLDDVKLTYKNPGSPNQTITDWLGQIYEAFGGKFVSLDLSLTNWQVPDKDSNQVKGIPGISHAEGVDYRPNKDKLANIKFPTDIEFISERAFMNSENLQKIDLNGLDRLKVIGPYAFYSCVNVKNIDFTGCTALELIQDRAFTLPREVEYLDFSPCTSLESIGQYVFAEPRKAKYIEFPASLKNLGDYQFRDCYSLEYVRFRSPVAPYFGWCQFNYHDWRHTWGDTGNPISDQYNGLTSIHRAEGVDGEYSERTDHMFPIYHPNNLTYTRGHGYYAADDDGYYFIGQNVPENTVGTKGVYPSDTEEFRGLSSITINATGLAPANNGKTVSTNVGVPNQTITGGAVSFTIGTPTVGLQALNPETGQIITGKYDEGTNLAKPTDDWGPGGVFGSNSGKLGKPWISDTTTQFAVLELTVDGGQKLEQSAEGAYKDGGGERTVYYVYVDKDVVITRVMRDKLQTVSLQLLRGWNMVEKCIFESGSMALWISGGIVEVDSAVLVDAEDTTSRPIPWIVR
ncbi:hypothetical protein AGMMS4952_17910 [Spirochaetia bacterium]|nr:hypothetical protein AGMMS4952_17910 [Spirochaetia bacterium]